MEALIPFNTLSALFLEALSRADWQTGRMARAEIQRAEDRLEMDWQATEDGSITVGEFKVTLSEWERVISTRVSQ